MNDIKKFNKIGGYKCIMGGIASILSFIGVFSWELELSLPLEELFPIYIYPGVLNLLISIISIILFSFPYIIILTQIFSLCYLDSVKK